jgi:Transcriptional regulator DsbA
MSIIQTSDFVIPSDPTVLKQIKDACFEISSSLTRIEGERSLIKEALDALSKDTDVPKKNLSKIARFFHKSNKDEVEAEHEASSELYDKVFGQNQI